MTIDDLRNGPMVSHLAGHGCFEFFTFKNLLTSFKVVRFWSFFYEIVPHDVEDTTIIHYFVLFLNRPTETQDDRPIPD